MQKIATILSVALALGLAATASAEPVTEAQIAEARKLLTRAELETLLEKKRLEVADLQPEGCTKTEVDYDLVPSNMAKGYDWTISYIRDGDFQAVPRGKSKVKKEGCWFKFDPGVSSEEAKKRIEASGEFLVADLWELNALGTAKPDLQRQFPIVGLGSRWRGPYGDVRVPFLGGIVSERGLSLRWFDGGWYPICRFLAVRK